MQGINKQRLRQSSGGGHSGFLFLAIMLLVLAGCATGGKPRPESTESPPVAEGPSVARLADGREGFIIREAPHMEPEAVRRFERAIAMMQDQDYDKAIELLEEVIEQSPGVTAPYINLAMAYQYLDQPEQAEQHLKTALELVPGHPVASNEYGLLLRKAGRFAEARTIYEKALKNFPDYQPARRNLGILCDLYLHDLGCALEQYEIYSEAKPDDEQVKLWIADLRMRLE